MSAGRAIGLVAAAMALAAAPARELAAQVRPPQDTTRGRPDTLAVPIPPRPDSLAADTMARRDTTRRDSVVTPLARAPRPAAMDIGGDHVWDRAQLFASGALTLADLLERIPGVASMRAGWLLPPEHAAYVGATDRVRVFLDGVELDELNPRTGGLLDVSAIELWPMEQVMIERAAGELRVHLRSWSVERTTPDSRVDISTGEYSTNVFRGFFGRRFARGEAIQAGFQQFSTRDPAFGGDGDQLALFARGGWAAGPWSVDGYYLRSRRLQNELDRRFDRPSLDALERSTQLAYLRGGWRDAAADGPWAQLLLSSQLFAETSDADVTGGDEGEDGAAADTSRSRAQYVLAAGWNGGPLAIAGAARVRVYEGERLLSPSARIAWSPGAWLRAEGRAERVGEDASVRLDGTVRLRPRDRLELVGTASVVRPGGEDAAPSSVALRGEAGLRVGRTWLVGGIVSRENASVLPPVVYDADFAPAALGTLVGFYGGVRGPVYRDLGVDVVATQWVDDAAAGAGGYVPEQQLRAQATLDTRWLSRFPRGTFGLKAAGIVEYRSGVVYPTVTGDDLVTLGAASVGGLLEIRIQEATAFIQSRNMLAIDYELVPGYLMPRNVILYGVRWQFWN